VRVAVIHNLPRGGAHRTMQEQLRLLDADVHEWCLAGATPVTASPNVVPLARIADRLAPPLRPLPRYLDLITLTLAWRRVAREVNRLGVDVVLAHPCRYLQAPPALRWITAPSVYFCHETRRVDYEPAAGASRNPATSRLYAALYLMERRLDRLGVASADTLLTNSHFTAARIKDAYGRTAEPVPLGVSAPFRESFTGAARGHLLSVGTLIPSKGHDLAIEAAAEARRPLPLVVVAPREDIQERARLERLATDTGTTLRISVGISDADLRDLYRGAVATLYLAADEPFGLAAIEAQACGSPVVVANRGGLPETLLAGETGFEVDRTDPAAAAAAIDTLESQDGLLERMSARAITHGQAYTWENSTAVLERSLEQVTKR
jgi:glycosyltransferase involved in cell wall biosynthesis